MYLERVLGATRVYARAELLDDYLQRILKHHIKKLGSGFETIVFAHPTLSDVVVCICPNDSGKAAWARACMKASHNPYLPVIHQISRAALAFGAKDYTFAVIFCEKLQKANVNVILAHYGALFSDFRSGKPGRYLQDHLENYDDAVREAFNLVASGYPKFRIDLHENNYMMRQGAWVVINDPWLNWRNRDRSLDSLEVHYESIPGS